MENFGSLLAAYIACWAIFFIFDFSVARRTARVEKQLAQLKKQLGRE